jgi:hypothetical protein
MTRTRVAVLGTLAEFHEGAVAFDLNALLDLVVEMHPDLLCLDIHPEQWRQGDFDDLPPEYRDALLPLADRSDIVVVPIGERRMQGGQGATGWREVLFRWLRAGLAALQRGAPSPEAINYGWRHDLANMMYHLIDRLDESGFSEEHAAHTHHLIENIQDVVQRDPQATILAVVNVRYCHLIRPALRQDPAIEVVPFHEM